ncbi:MAG: ECF transporter S component [Clostridia bacterium]|nr:ECF transporter S component [Clostridia bacterium]
MKKKYILFSICTVAVAAAISLLGAMLFPDRAAALILTVWVCALTCIGAVAFEVSRISVLRISLTAAMTALSVVGRVVFYAVPFFKPVSAAVILCGIWLGPVPGMVCGALSALLSGVFFGYGLWLPFQILAWGVIGLIAGLLAKTLKKSRLLLCTYGIFAAVFFSAFMDVFTVLEFGRFSAEMYVAAVIAALPVTVIYAASNLIFLLVLTPTVGRRMRRVEASFGGI